MPGKRARGDTSRKPELGPKPARIVATGTAMIFPHGVAVSYYCLLLRPTEHDGERRTRQQASRVCGLPARVTAWAVPNGDATEALLCLHDDGMHRRNSGSTLATRVRASVPPAAHVHAHPHLDSVPRRDSGARVALGDQARACASGITRVPAAATNAAAASVRRRGSSAPADGYEARAREAGRRYRSTRQRRRTRTRQCSPTPRKKSRRRRLTSTRPSSASVPTHRIFRINPS